jgi:hypothetical protein
MKKLSFALASTAALALAGCHKDNEDQVQNVELNQPTADVLNEQANDAAADAANTTAPVAHAPADTNASADVTSPSDDQEQNVSGM